jgi:hypothetical protein
MAIDSKITDKINEFVRFKPRTIQEISEHIKKNWRTAERYVEKIEKETGCLSTRIFRGGTRGALKIVYWNSIEEIHSTTYQEELFKDIMNGKSTGDFFPFDIYQHVPQKLKKAYIEDISKIDPEVNISEEQDLIELLKKAEKQVIFFSGNLSWVNAKQGEKEIFDVIEDLVKKDVSIKVLARISLVGAENAKKLLSLNKNIGKNLIEIRHRYHPVRAIIIDDKVVRLRDIKDPKYYNAGELKRKIGVFYYIYDKEWIEWLQKVFWKMFSIAMTAEKRIEETDLIENRMKI